MNSVGVQPADVVVELDVTAFDLTEFTRTQELATLGEQVALQQIPQIKSLLPKLDPELFPFGE